MNVDLPFVWEACLLLSVSAIGQRPLPLIVCPRARLDQSCDGERQFSHNRDAYVPVFTVSHVWNASYVWLDSRVYCYCALCVCGWQSSIEVVIFIE